jgi:hypothetical protein
MTTRKRNWLISLALLGVLTAAGLFAAARILAARIEPYARQAAMRYLSQRFDSDVQLSALHIRLPNSSLMQVLLTRGRGSVARIEGEGLALRLKSHPEAPPLFTIQRFRAEVKVDSILSPPLIVPTITVDGMDIQIPPRASATPPKSAPESGPDASESEAASRVKIGEVAIHSAALTLLPRDPRKIPLRFDIQSLQLESTGPGAAMNYTVVMKNAKPPGDIHASGAFGPWFAREPGITPVSGDYRFENADLGVFAAIAGTLNSTGHFEGQLSALTAKGEASVPNFRLRMSGNPVPLKTRFTVLVDGTNGNTTLQPVSASLGRTSFTTSGGIIRHEPNQPRAIGLSVSMPDGDMRDVLRLAMKGEPFMEGRLALKAKIDIPPLTGKVRQKLILDGQFEVIEGKFLHSSIQSQIDNLSKRARGNPESEETDSVVSRMAGIFHLENSVMQFSKLTFSLPGAGVDLAGNYNLDSDALDFDGALKLQATVSEMMTGWKRVALKPMDRFFEKGGAGTYLHLRVDGTSKAPKLGVILAGKRLEAPLPKH